jgi:hypothetical protein
MSYREWRQGYRQRTAAAYVGSYPWSALVIGVALGLAGAVIFRNALAGVTGAVGATGLGLWYWKPGGRGRRSVED